jgi:hypothetical protein
MKKTAGILVAALIVLGITSCKKTKDDINKATEFDMTYASEFTIPSSPSYTATTPVDFNSPDIPTQSSSKFAAEETTKDLIEEIKLTKFTISNPSGNLNFVSSIAIYIKTSGLGDVLVASKSNIPQNVSSVSADLTGANIKEFIFKDKIQFRVTATITSGLSTEQKLKIDETVHVKGKRI